MKSHESWSPRNWIVPPGLVDTITRFDVRCESIIKQFHNKNSIPLMIKGETGVGKTLFVEYLLLKLNVVESKIPVRFVNCAALPEHLLESMIFGYKKGSHSTAYQDSSGILGNVDNGVLVLEEIGEMSKILQAKLLTVIETKIYYQLGSDNLKFFSGQIISTTNAGKDVFRDDFWYRFETFNVPPIRKRRSDVLYYIENFDYDLIGILTKGNVLSLLSYNWPGNVREIERVCNALREDIKIRQKENEKLKERFGESSYIGSNSSMNATLVYSQEASGLRLNKPTLIAQDMSKVGVKQDRIERVLKKYSLSFDCFKGSFENKMRMIFKKEDVFQNYAGCICLVNNLQYNNVYHGFLIFCKLFLQDVQAENDILEFNSPIEYSGKKDSRYIDVTNTTYYSKELKSAKVSNLVFKVDSEAIMSTMFYSTSLYNFKHWNVVHKNAFLESFKFLTKVRKISFDDISDIESFYSKNSSNAFLTGLLRKHSKESEDEGTIEDYTIKSLKELYYETVCAQIGTSHGFKKKLAKIAGLSQARISQDFNILGLNQKFSQLNFKPKKRIKIFS